MRKIYPFLCLLLCLVVSCKEKDTIVPTISILQPLAHDTVRNEVTVKMDATDNKGVSKVELFVNDSLVGTALKSPFEITWNTLSFEDGMASVKGVVYDQKGNKQESTAKVYINNSLLNLTVDKTYLGVYETGTIVVSDLEGNVLNATDFTNSDVIKLKPKVKYEGESVNITVIKKYDYTNLYSYINVKRGSDWKLWLSNTVTSPLPVRDAKVHFTNFPEGINQLWCSTNLSSRTMHSMEDTVGGVPISYNDESKLYLQVKKPEGHFYNILDINATNQKIHVDASTINKPSLKKSIPLPIPNEEGAIYLLGRPQKDVSDKAYWLYNSNGYFYNTEMLDAFYPDFNFAEYVTIILYDYNNQMLSQVNIGAIPAKVEPLIVDMEVQSPSLSDFKASISGSFNYYQTNFMSSTGSTNWEVYSSSNKTTYKLPDIATVINRPGIELDKFKLHYVTMMESDDYVSSPYLGFNSSLPGYNPKFSRGAIKIFLTTDGRVAKKAKPQLMPKSYYPYIPNFNK